MYAGRVACCPLVSHIEHVPRALLKLEKIWDNHETTSIEGGISHYLKTFFVGFIKICSARFINFILF